MAVDFYKMCEWSRNGGVYEKIRRYGRRLEKGY